MNKNCVFTQNLPQDWFCRRIYALSGYTWNYVSAPCRHPTTLHQQQPSRHTSHKPLLHRWFCHFLPGVFYLYIRCKIHWKLHFNSFVVELLLCLESIGSVLRVHWAQSQQSQLVSGASDRNHWHKRLVSQTCRLKVLSIFPLQLCIRSKAV